MRIRRRLCLAGLRARSRFGPPRFERAEQPLEGTANSGVLRRPADVAKLPRIAVQVVELTPAAPVLDVEVAARVDSDIRRRARTAKRVSAQVLDQVGTAPRHGAAAEE